ncbi:MAG: hypothetical protein JXB62_12260, partial [Pirellulales bacterium]|nr:hypothetical protein [Pirellulales bacterium]
MSCLWTMARRGAVAVGPRSIGLLGHFLKDVSGSWKSASRRMSMWLIVLRRFLAGGDGPKRPKMGRKTRRKSCGDNRLELLSLVGGR